MAFKFRGLCDLEEKIDLDYVLLRETLKSGAYTFKGLTGLNDIVYNPNGKKWELFSLFEINNKTGRTLGFTNSTKFFPVGLQQWYLYEQCNQYQDDVIPVILKLTKVTRLFYSGIDAALQLWPFSNFCWKN